MVDLSVDGIPGVTQNECSRLPMPKRSATPIPGTIFSFCFKLVDARTRSQGPGVAKREIAYALPEEGIGAEFVAKKLSDLSRAQKRRWNRKKGCWEKFEDHRTQRAAIREVFKILEIYPKKEKDLENENKTFKIEISAIPSRRVPVPDSRSDGRERSER
jgi:hypothetical protein